MQNNSIHQLGQLDVIKNKLWKLHSTKKQNEGRKVLEINLSGLIALGSLFTDVNTVNRNCK